MWFSRSGYLASIAKFRVKLSTLNVCSLGNDVKLNSIFDFAKNLRSDFVC